MKCDLLLWLLYSIAAVGQTSHNAHFINTWLVLGTFDNDASNTGYNRDWIDEVNVQPKEGMVSAGLDVRRDRQVWRYFDDRLFSRNYDDYQDLFSYFKIKRAESVAAKVAYAHVYVHSPGTQRAQLCISANNEFKSWMNGVLVASSTEVISYRRMIRAEVTLDKGWNRLLVKIANQEDGRFGFYAGLCNDRDKQLPGLTFSVNGGQNRLMVSTKTMSDIDTGSMPVGYREWPYVGIDPLPIIDADLKPYLMRRPDLAVHSSDFLLTAEGGIPPYRWSLVGGKLPDGLSLLNDGTIKGTIQGSAALGEHCFSVQVTDSENQTATKRITINVQERPNKWYEESRLTALIHSPEGLKEKDMPAFARLMKQQGYSLGMVISYNNGLQKYRWPSLYHPDNPMGDVVGSYKAALEKEGVRFGMYLGNLNGTNHGGRNGAILMLEEAMRRYNPSAFWFDWAGWQGFSLDALYSMIKSYNPDTLIVLNGISTIFNGDWDIIVLEGWRAWGERHWNKFPFHVSWPKRGAVETWRLVADPKWEGSIGIYPDWQEYMRLQISLIGEGFVANIDHSPTLRHSDTDPSPATIRKIPTLNESVVIQCHQQMAAWANPPGIPPLYESYTKVNPGPLNNGDWGYNTINLSRDTVYVHILKNPMGKTGKPNTDSFTVKPVRQQVNRAIWMNKQQELPFTKKGNTLTISLDGVEADPVDTIVKIKLAGKHPIVKSDAPQERLKNVPPGNLATGKPALLLSVDGQRVLTPSSFHFARFGNDGISFTFAQGGGEWAWTYHADLQKVHPVEQVVIHFGPGYATEYNLLLSEDGEQWQTVGHVIDCTGGRREHTFVPVRAQYIRVQAVKPDGPEQEGGQMSIAELEVYATK